MEDNPHHTLALGWNCATWPLGSRNIPLPAFPDQCRGFICCSGGRNTHSPNLKSLTVHRKEKNGLKFHQRRFKLDIRENLFSERVVKYWHRLFRDSESPSLEVFQSHGNVTLRDMGMVAWVILEVFSNLHDSTILHEHNTVKTG